jgi:predicted short-subunit dehydrogenase-like oxidoreductase (DUF2520 family)
MDIVIIGTGNTATILSKKLNDAGHTIKIVFGRNLSKANELSSELNTKGTNQIENIPGDADIYIVAVSDTAIAELAAHLNVNDKIVVHTAASVSKDVLKNCSENYGVFYPLQTLKKETAHLPDIPIIIDANNDVTLNSLDQLADSISNMVVKADDDKRLKLHMAAVFCNNFTNHIYALMEDYCNIEKLDFNLLKPLIKETAIRLTDLAASSAQTGPGVRSDSETINKHLAILNEYPDLKELYIMLTGSIQKFYS